MAQPKGKGMVFVCVREECKSHFVAGNSLAKYCSATCRSIAGNRMAQERRRDRGEITCKWCKNVFTPAYGDKRKVFCSGRCKVSQEYKLKPGSTHRRRAKKYGCFYQKVDKLKVFDRDEWKCYICGSPTPKNRMGTTERNAPEQDHVIPLSQGGRHAYDNIRCACRACNNSKGVEERKAAMVYSQTKEGGV